MRGLVAVTTVGVVSLLVFAVAAVRAQVGGTPRCNGKKPDYDSLEYCDGGVQSTCETIEYPPACTGQRKDRSLVTYNCVDGECTDHCVSVEQACWVEYQCVWNAGQGKCENGAVTGSASTTAKASLACLAPRPCPDQ